MDSSDLRLSDILALDGDVSDYNLLKDLKKTKKGKKDKQKKKKKTAADDDFDKQEFQNLIDDLGIRKASRMLMGEIPEEEEDVKDVTEETSADKETDAIQSAPPTVVSQSEDDPNAKPLLTKSKKNIFKSINFDALPKKYLVQPGNLWYQNLEEVSLNAAEDATLESDEVEEIKEFALKLLTNEISLYKRQAKNATGGAQSWMQSVASSGTLSDRISSLSLMIKESPIHNYRCLDSIMVMVKKKGKREAFIALKAFQDLLIDDLLPQTNRLKYFESQKLSGIVSCLAKKDGLLPLLDHAQCKLALIVYAFEHKLKELVKSFVDYLKTLAYDPLDAAKAKAMSTTLNMLISRPEQERALLSLLVSKLGDPKYKFASKALHMLNRVVADHPMMQAIIVDEVRNLLLRPNLSVKAQYYCICYLNTQVLDFDRKEVAQQLINIYMNFFKASVNKKAKINGEDKMLGALLTGVTRAFPFADIAETEISEQIDILFKTVHVTNLSTTIRGLCVLFQVFNSRSEVSDRFYTALYSSLRHPQLPFCTARHPMYLNLLYRSVKADPVDARLRAFIKRLLQITSLQMPAFTSACLILISELSHLRPAISYQFLSSSSSGGATSDDNSAVDNPDAPRSVAQMMVDFNSDDDEEEAFHDVDEEKDDKKKDDDGEVKTSWTHQHKNKILKGKPAYNPYHRAPQFSGAELCSAWELHSLKRHFHPTVSLFTKNLIHSNYEKPASSNPLDDYTLLKFLDRFVYRNPKDVGKSKKSKRKQSLSIHQRNKNEKFNDDRLPVNSQAFLDSNKVSVDDLFFYKYFSGANQKPPKSKSNRIKKSDDLESLSDDEFDAFMASEEGQKSLDMELNYSDHIYKNTAQPIAEQTAEEEDSEDEDEPAEAGGDSEDELFDELEGDADFMDADAFEGFSDDDEGGELKPQKKKKPDKSSNREDMNDFDMILEENSRGPSNAGGSSALRNHDRSSAKQMRWEQKNAERDVVAKKRQFKSFNKKQNNKRSASQFDKRNNNKGGGFNKKRKFK